MKRERMVTTGHSQRILHDDALGTLHLTSEGTVAPDRIRRHCADTVAAMHAVLEHAEANDEREWTTAGADLMGLPGAYAQLVHEIRAASPIPVELNVPGRRNRLPALAPDRFKVLLRAVLEGTRNAGRHGMANSVTLTIWADRREVHLHVADRGTGCPGPFITETGRIDLHARTRPPAHHRGPRSDPDLVALGRHPPGRCLERRGRA